MGRCYPAEGKLTLLLQALKLCVVALGLLQRVLRADPQGKFANTHRGRFLPIIVRSSKNSFPTLGDRNRTFTH